MANFTPFNNYLLFILDKIIEKFKLKPPFLDIACGYGYLSKHLGKKGWSGKAIDLSKQAVEITKFSVKKYKFINVERKDFLKIKGIYKTVFMLDILEHIKDDVFALKKARSLLSIDGHLVIAIPSNHKEWRWDDNFYGHFRRYTQEELSGKLIKAGFKPIVFYDYTFPFFWTLRRIYTKIISKKKRILDREKQTKQSSFSYAWSIPIVSSILDRTSFLWLPIFITQYVFFRNYISKGNALIVLAKKGKRG